jgi:hypothetical protein
MIEAMDNELVEALSDPKRLQGKIAELARTVSSLTLPVCAGSYALAAIVLSSAARALDFAFRAVATPDELDSYERLSRLIEGRSDRAQKSALCTLAGANVSTSSSTPNVQN